MLSYQDVGSIFIAPSIGSNFFGKTCGVNVEKLKSMPLFLRKTIFFNFLSDYFKSKTKQKLRYKTINLKSCRQDYTSRKLILKLI